MDLARLDRGMQIAGASALALVVFMFFPWYGRTAAALDIDFGVNLNAWQAFGLIDIVLLAISAFVVAVAFFGATDREMRLPLSASTLVAALGILATILVAYRLLDPPVDLERRYGLYLGLVAALGIAIGGRMSMGERRETFADARDTVSDRVSETRRRAADTIGGEGGSEARYEDRTKEDLYEEATRRNIEGRSEMSKEELAEALRRSR